MSSKYTAMFFPEHSASWYKSSTNWSRSSSDGSVISCCPSLVTITGIMYDKLFCESDISFEKSWISCIDSSRHFSTGSDTVDKTGFMISLKTACKVSASTFSFLSIVSFRIPCKANFLLFLFSSDRQFICRAMPCFISACRSESDMLLTCTTPRFQNVLFLSPQRRVPNKGCSLNIFYLNYSFI